MADISAIETRIWSILEPYRERLDASTIYGIPALKWPGAKAHDYFAAVKAGKNYLTRIWNNERPRMSRGLPVW
jgi:hypothetical protein